MPIFSLHNLLSSLPTLPVPTHKQKQKQKQKPLPFLCTPPQTLSLSLSLNQDSTDDWDALKRTCFPALACANVLHFKSGYYNVEVVVGEHDSEEAPLRRFRRAVLKAGIIQECRRRMFFEDTRARRKRKSREAARKNRKRSYRPKSPPPSKKQESLKQIKEEEEDNWELPEGELPY